MSTQIGMDVVALLMVALVLGTVVMILRARQGILIGNWLLHRQRMLVALGLWAAALALGVAIIGDPAVHAPFAIGIPLLAAIAVSALLLRVLMLMARHRLLEHKLLARQVIWAWIAAAVALGGGFVFAAATLG